MPGPANALNINAQGLVYFDGVHTFSGIDGGTAGYICVSTGPMMPPDFVDPSLIAGISTIDGDSGSATGGTITLTGGTSGAIFTASGSTITESFNFLSLPATTSTDGQIFINSISALSLPLLYSAMGGGAGNTTFSGDQNTGFGMFCFANLGSGPDNTAYGINSSTTLTSGQSNSSFGGGSLYNNISGSYNNAFGFGALAQLTTGDSNLGLGFNASYQVGGNYTSSESNNIVIQNVGVTGESNVMRLGTTGSGDGQVNSSFIAGITGTTPTDANSPQVVLCDNTGNMTVIPDSVAGYVLKSNYPNSPTFQDAGSAIITINVDQSGSVTGSTFSLFANSGSANCGSSIDFINSSGNEIDLVVTDASNNTIFGSFAGNSSISGNANTGYGNYCLHDLGSGQANTGFGASCLNSVTSGGFSTALGYACLELANGSYNIGAGYSAGINYTGSESSNIVIGNAGVTSESNVMRIGTQGNGDGQINLAFMAGITSGTPVSANSPQVVLCDNTGNLTVVADPTSGLPLVSNSPNDPTFQVLGITGGGTGLSSTPTDGQLLIGNTGTSSFDLATLTQGAGIIITNAGGTITIAATGGSPGTVTAVQGDDNVPVMPDISGIIYTKGGTGITTSGNALTSTETFSLSVPVVVTSGGTGAITLTNHAVLLGQGTSAVGFVGPSSTVGLPLVGAGSSADPAFSVLGVVGGGSGQNTLTGILTGNGVSAFTASTVNQYQLLVGGASNSVSSISSSTANFIMTSNGPSSNPTFQINKAGLILISTTTASAGDYIITLPGGYFSYVLYFSNLFPNTNGDFTELLVSTDGGVTYANACQSGINVFNYNSASAVNFNSTSVSYLSGHVHSSGVGEGATGYLYFSTRGPNFVGNSTFCNTASGNIQSTAIFSGAFSLVSAVTTIKITSPTSGQLTFGFVCLYGLNQ